MRPPGSIGHPDFGPQWRSGACNGPARRGGRELLCLLALLTRDKIKEPDGSSASGINGGRKQDRALDAHCPRSDECRYKPQPMPQADALHAMGPCCGLPLTIFLCAATCSVRLSCSCVRGR